MKHRTLARELALQILYQQDVRGDEILEQLPRLLEESEKSEAIQEFAETLVRGTIASIEDADRRITEVAEHWDIRRMAIIDRNILRLAVYEMTERPEVPEKVSINEAIELGKKYSTGKSGAFINGILDRIRRNLMTERGETD